MFPILLKIPIFGLFGYDSFPIHTYGLMVALGFLGGTWYVQRTAKKIGENPAQALDLIFYILIAAILGSRILFVLVSQREAFFHNPFIIFKIWEGGLVFYGGFIASILASIFYLRRHHLPVWKYFDLFAPGVALGHAIGRIGCFAAGCCYGRPLLSAMWYSVIFPDNPASLAPVGIPLYPTQLIESAGEFITFLFLAFFAGRKKFEGQIIALYFMIYALLRFTVEFFRGDLERGFIGESGLSTSQLIAAILFAIGLGMYLYRRSRGRTLAQ